MKKNFLIIILGLFIIESVSAQEIKWRIPNIVPIPLDSIRNNATEDAMYIDILKEMNDKVDQNINELKICEKQLKAEKDNLQSEKKMLKSRSDALDKEESILKDNEKLQKQEMKNIKKEQKSLKKDDMYTALEKSERNKALNERKEEQEKKARENRTHYEDIQNRRREHINANSTYSLKTNEVERRESELKRLKAEQKLKKDQINNEIKSAKAALKK